MNLFFNDEYRVTQRASWPIAMLAERNPELLKPYLKTLIYNLKSSVHDAVKRNSTKILLILEIPEELLGVTIDIMFKFLMDPKEPVAIKANAITIIYRLAQNEPDLIRELKLIIEDQLPYASPGFTSRAKKILKD